MLLKDSYFPAGEETLIVEALITKACSQAIRYSLLQSVFHLTVDETVSVECPKLIGIVPSLP